MSENAPVPASEPRRPQVVTTRTHRIIVWTTVIVGAVLVLGAIGGGIALKATTDQIVAQSIAAAQAAQQAQDAAEEAERVALEQQQEQDRQDHVERVGRADVVEEITAAVRALGEQHVAEGLIAGPIIDVFCEPAVGSSIDDLAVRTTELSCFVADLDNGDGSLSGYYYSATMDWDAGTYTYGIVEQ